MAKKTTAYRAIWLFCLCFIGLFASASQTEPVENQKTEILIGAHLPLSGMGSLVGGEQRWAYNQAVKDINENGGIFVEQYNKKLPVRLIVIDDESDPIKAAEATEKLITQTKVDLMLSGQVGSMGALAGMVTAEKYKTYYHGTVVWIPDFLKHDFEWCTLYFMTIESMCIAPYAVWNSLPPDQRPQRPALFLEDSTDGRQIAGLLTALAERYGYEIALTAFIDQDAKDYSYQILDAKSAGVDAIIMFANVPQSVTLVRQMKKMNYSVKFLQGFKGTWASEFYEALGEDSDYVLCDGFWSEDYPFPKARELGERYYNDYEKRSVGVGMYYAVCQTLWQAIEKAGTLNSAEVRQAVLDNEFDTVMGKVDYDDRGVALFTPANFQWWKGKQQLIYPLKYSNFEIKIAPPWDEREQKTTSSSKGKQQK